MIDDSNSNEVSVEYCSTHTGHSQQLAHLPIPLTIKNEISAKLHGGVGMDRILDDIRDNIDEQKILSREHLINKQDISNIKMKLNLENVVKDKNDLISTNAWVQEMKEMPYNPVLLYKSQGEEVEDSNFILALQTEFQKLALQKHGMKVVMMDATHGVSQYGFLLISILVIDDHGEGLPVAWAISNREDTKTLIEFLSPVRSHVGDIACQFFMSDCAEQYYNAWVNVFGTNDTKRLICRWHIDRAWRKALQRHIDSHQERIKVYHQLYLS